MTSESEKESSLNSKDEFLRFRIRFSVLALNRLAYGKGHGIAELSMMVDDWVSDPFRETSTTTPKPELCSSLRCKEAVQNLDAALDPTTDPCQDFYKFACGTFEATKEISSGRGHFNQFITTGQTIKFQLKRILEANSTDEEPSSRKKAKLYYSSCMDVEAVERDGVVQLREMAQDFGGLLLSGDQFLAPDWNLAALITAVSSLAIDPLFMTTVERDLKNVSSNAISIYQYGLGLGEDTRDYYTGKNVTEDEVLVAYTDLLENYAKILFNGTNVTIDRDLIVDVVIFEQKLAEAQESLADQSATSEKYKKVNISKLDEKFGFISWSKFFGGLFSSAGLEIDLDIQICLFAFDYFEKLSPLIVEYQQTPEGRRTLQNYVAFLAIGQFAPRYGGSLQKVNDDFTEVFIGQKGSQERWQFCLYDIDDVLGFPLAAIFIEQHFSAHAKQQAEEMVSEIYRTVRPRIENADWMLEETKRRALEKLDALTFEVGYPYWLLNATFVDFRYQRLNVTENYAKNQIEVAKSSKSRELAKLTQTPNKHDWFFTPQTVNAYNELETNKFVIPAGILQRPFYYADDDLPLALSYGAIGSIIAHEITHTFDNRGRLHDKDGYLTDWWDEETSEKFVNRSACLVDKFDTYKFENIHLRGDQTLAENIADNGGVRIAYQAYQNALSGNNGTNLVATTIPGLSFTGEQLFFLGYAQAWCSVITPEAAKLDIFQDTHSLPKFRVNGPLSDFDEFSKAFNCKLESPMNPQKKCTVW